MIDSFRLEIAIASLSFASLLSLETRLAAALAQVLTPCLMSLFVAENSSMSGYNMGGKIPKNSGIKIQNLRTVEEI